MAMFVQTITASEVLAALTNDTTKWNGADIDMAISGVAPLTKQTNYISDAMNWNQAADGTVDYVLATPVDNIPDVGTWYIGFQFSTLGTSNDLIDWKIMRQDANNYVRFYIVDSADANGHKLTKMVASANTNLILMGSAESGTAAHYLEATRDIFGNYELLRDGVSLGTATDTFHPTIADHTFGFNDSGGGSDIDITDIRHTGFA